MNDNSIEEKKSYEKGGKEGQSKILVIVYLSSARAAKASDSGSMQ